MYKVVCGKCKGTGVVECYRYHDSGVCYECKGIGHFMRKTKPVQLVEYHVTAIIKDGYCNSGSRGGVYVDAKSEKDAFKKARLHPDSYDLETLQANCT
jgi:RecJ-like exonuclease